MGAIAAAIAAIAAVFTSAATDAAATAATATATATASILWRNTHWKHCGSKTYRGQCRRRCCVPFLHLG